MLALVRPAVLLFLALSAITGLAYPAAVGFASRVLFPAQAVGSLIVRGETPVGSRLIGQNFTGAKYFWGRPSATSPQPYNGAGSNGSNLGPRNPALADAVRARVDALRRADPQNRLPVPVDLVTASASGLDPHIGVAAARYQAGRVARERGLSTEAVLALVENHVEGRQWGLFGEARVNVLELNLALDSLR